MANEPDRHPPDIFNLILKFFDHDVEKSRAWSNTPNRFLGDMRPYDMIKKGKIKKLEKFIRDQMEEND